MTTPVTAVSWQEVVNTFLISLKGVFDTLNMLEGEEDENLGLGLRDLIRDFLHQPSRSQVADDEAREKLWRDLGLFVTAKTEPILAKVPPLTGHLVGPKHHLYDLILKHWDVLMTSTTTPASTPPVAATPPARPPSTPAPAPAPAPTPPAASAPVPITSARSVVLGPTVEDLYLDPDIQSILMEIMEGYQTFADLALAVENYTPPVRYKGGVLKGLVTKFANSEGWAKDAKAAFAAEQADLAEQRRLDEDDAKLFESLRVNSAAAKQIIIDATTGSAKRTRTGKGGFFLKRFIRSIPLRGKWWLSGFFLGAIVVLAAFTLYVRQPNHVTETTNNVVTNDETVDEMYSWTVILSATAGFGVVIGFGLVGIYCSFVERKESGA